MKFVHGTEFRAYRFGPEVYWDKLYGGRWCSTGIIFYIGPWYAGLQWR